MRRLMLLLSCLLFTALSYGQENCYNGFDDDGDGKIDLNDDDCACHTAVVANLVSNHDFEQMNFCPIDFAQFNAVKNWFLPSSATTDYINVCGFVPASATDAGIYPLPAANGNGVAGILVSNDYKEFIGICTNATLLAGTKYQLNFDIAASTSGRLFLETNPNIGEICNEGVLNAGRTDMTLYGRSNCDTSMPADTNHFPPGWQSLGTVSYLPSKSWNQLSIVFTPSVDIKAIMLGAPQNLPNMYANEYDYQGCFPYFYFDNMILNNVSDLGLKISPVGSFCENSLVLNADIDAAIGIGYSFQWYKNGVAILGATNSNLPLNYHTDHLGDYQVKIQNSSLCRISPFYNVNAVIEVPEYTINQSPCFPGTTILTITTPADAYSFDNGATWTTSPSKGNLTAFNRIQVLVRKNGCTSSARYVFLTYPALETTNIPPEVIVVQPGCQTNGSITVSTPALEYSFDDGVSWTRNPILNNLPPNPNHDYKVRIKTLLGCITIAKYVLMLPFRHPEPTATSTNAGCGLGGSITITTPAQEYSIDGGLTWSTNPTFTNLSTLGSNSYGVVIKDAFNCISETKTVFLGTDYLQKPEVTFTQPNCGTSGSITIVTPALAYSFDDGATWSTANVATNLPSGFYYVKVKDALNCVSLAEIVYLETYFLDVEIDYSVTNSSCASNGKINIATVAQEYSIDDGLTWSSNPFFANLSANYYFLKVRNGLNCESNTTIVNLQDFTDMSADYQIAAAGCNTYGAITITTLADLYSFDNGISWSLNNTLAHLTGNANYTLVVKSNHCTSQPIIVNFNSNYIPNPTVSDYQAFVCDTDNDQVEHLNLTDYNEFLIANSATFNFYYFTSIAAAQNLNLSDRIQDYENFKIANDNSPVYVAVLSPDNCASIAQIRFSFLATPTLSTIPDRLILCQNSTVTVIPNNNLYEYSWSNGSISNRLTISEPGNYSVTATIDYGNKRCSTTKDFSVVLSNPAVITHIENQDWTDTENVIIVSTNGLGNYEFSIDGINFQDDNMFSGLNSGAHTIHVRDKNGCGITKVETFSLMYPKVFTPNDDGYNDTWAIQFSHGEPKLKLNIFDRYGKLLKTLNYTDFWDGKYEGVNLPSDDYWFVVTRGNGKEYKGHFTLKR